MTMLYFNISTFLHLGLFVFSGFSCKIIVGIGDSIILPSNSTECILIACTDDGRLPVATIEEGHFDSTNTEYETLTRWTVNERLFFKLRNECDNHTKHIEWGPSLILNARTSAPVGQLDLVSESVEKRTRAVSDDNGQHGKRSVTLKLAQLSNRGIYLCYYGNHIERSPCVKLAFIGQENKLGPEDPQTTELIIAVCAMWCVLLVLRRPGNFSTGDPSSTMLHYFPTLLLIGLFFFSGCSCKKIDQTVKLGDNISILLNCRSCRIITCTHENHHGRVPVAELEDCVLKPHIGYKNRTNMVGNGTLLIGNTTLNDTGLYAFSCNGQRTPTMPDVDVVVFNDTHARVGQDALLPCYADPSDGEMTFIRWETNGTLVLELDVASGRTKNGSGFEGKAFVSAENVQQDGNLSMTLKQVQLSYQGIYLCYYGNHSTEKKRGYPPAVMVVIDQDAGLQPSDTSTINIIIDVIIAIMGCGLFAILIWCLYRCRSARRHSSNFSTVSQTDHSLDTIG